MEEQVQIFDELSSYQQPASTGARFANYLIDLIVFYVCFFGCMFLLGIILAVAGEAEAFNEFIQEGVGKLVFYLIMYMLYVAYYMLSEGTSKGRTIGKLITRTKAVQDSGFPITWKQALLRSLCRLIPFEPFSAFSGYPWHDKMTNTIVVRK